MYSLGSSKTVRRHLGTTCHRSRRSKKANRMGCVVCRVVCVSALWTLRQLCDDWVHAYTPHTGTQASRLCSMETYSNGVVSQLRKLTADTFAQCKNNNIARSTSNPLQDAQVMAVFLDNTHMLDGGLVGLVLYDLVVRRPTRWDYYPCAAQRLSEWSWFPRVTCDNVSKHARGDSFSSTAGQLVGIDSVCV